MLTQRSADPGGGRPDDQREQAGATDVAEATRAVLELGAARASDVYEGDGWQVLGDPQENEFCLLRPSP